MLDIVRRLLEVSEQKIPTHHKSMITKPEKDILLSDIRIQRTEIIVPCKDRAWKEDITIIKIDTTAAIKPIVTPSGIELNKQIVAFGNTHSTFKYFGVVFGSQIVKGYSFYATNIHDRDAFHEMGDNESSLTFPGIFADVHGT